MKKGWVIALALVLLGGVTWAEDDIEALRARLAAQDARMANQDARMRDLEAKMMSAKGPNEDNLEGITSLRKNAVVTIGGFASPSYVGSKYKIESTYGDWGDGTSYRDATYRKRAESSHGSLEFIEAELHIGFTIGDNIDGFAAIDLNAVKGGGDWGVAKDFWIRYKNICNTGFGLKAGRDNAAFGGIAYGYLDSYATLGDGASWVGNGAFGANPNVLGLAADTGNYGYGSEVAGFGSMPLHNYWLMKGVNQITPYWESQDGKLKVEVSAFQTIDVAGYNGGGGYDNFYWNDLNNSTHPRSGYNKYTSTNRGLPSLSTKISWTPIEGLELIASAMNIRRNSFADGDPLGITDVSLDKNNFATYLGFMYRPCFLPKLNVWGQWVHGWNVANVKDLDSDSFNLGAAWSFTDKFTVFFQGDYLRSRYKGTGRRTGINYNNKGTAWAAYGGAQYDFGNGLTLEAGWRHENIKYKEWGQRVSKITGDMVYASLLIAF